MSQLKNKKPWKHVWEEVVLDYIQLFVKQVEYPFIIKDIWTKINDDLGISIDKKYVHEALKHKLLFTYKRISSRPLLDDSYRHLLLRKLFALEYINLWQTDSLIINVDEVQFSNKTKSNYTWARRGKTAIAQNIIFSGSISLITAVTSSGEWFRSHLKTNNNSDWFTSFMKKILTWIQFDLNRSLEKTIFLMDNCSIHKSKKTIEFLSKWRALIVFVPPYTPEMWPVELIFNIIKKRLQIQIGRSMLNLNLKSAEREIREVFSTITKKEILECFAHSMKIVKLYSTNSL